ncbi:hypothetical protein SAMN05444280_10313 [Tangfeifania diversioriginum]|uniref:Uncharacterized protein n=1 Tax=Tangfeifania diversioriginum TaxID=1168035 RepID=A0A1M6BS13_9BACT|nr:hypothetical protein [Tangfeifania diversioriginum]SHI51522.1 hypothetical protein SAMN05444280_10313 [Tangfeifania diversioriginum]
MKKFFASTEEKRNFNGFDVLTSNEMLQVRGGGDVRPDTREKDIFEFDEEEGN